MTINYKETGGKESFFAYPKLQYRVSQWGKHDCSANNNKNGGYNDCSAIHKKNVYYCENPGLTSLIDKL